ncbi:hypothetical protein [Empedobacter brevis]|uniref:hypothetical protein n=1 Tax=Empedobacter brevis TaxID=247 RepID=UPI002FE0EE77
MKKTLILLTTLFGIGGTYAQTIFEKTSKNYIERITNKNEWNKRFDLVSFNKVKMFSSPTEALESGEERRYDKPAEDLQPFASINVQSWGFGNNVDNGETLFFSTESKFNAGAYFSFTLYTDDLKVEKQFKINIPETANSVQVVNGFSSKIIDNNNKLIIPIYVHYFEGGQGPEYQKHAIWFVNETGEIVSKVEASGLEIIVDSKGKTNVFAYIDTESEYILKKIDLNNEANTKQIAIDGDLVSFFAGVPLTHKNLNNNDYIVFNHYTEKLVDNSTLTFNTNAKFVVEFINYETFEIEKSYQLPVIGFNEEEPYTIPMVTYGMFYNTGKYDITQTTFNTDNKLEFVYGTYFYNMILDEEWYHYYVVNEDGIILKKLEGQIANTGPEIGIPLQELPNQKDQVALLLGSEGGISNIRVYNLPELDLVYDFQAVHHDDLLSLNFNRLSNGNSINYVFGLNYAELEGDKAYGLVKHYDSNGNEVKKVRLPISTKTERFAPFLTAATLDPFVVNSDDKIEYVYAYQDRVDNQLANTYTVAQDENRVIASFSGRTAKGNVTSAGYFTNRKGELNRLYIYYGGDYQATSFITDFYKLPLEILTVNDLIKNKQSIHYLNNVKEIRIDHDYQTYQVYTINGNLISSGNALKTILTNGWKKGVYIIKTLDRQGKSNTAKILVY